MLSVLVSIFFYLIPLGLGAVALWWASGQASRGASSATMALSRYLSWIACIAAITFIVYTPLLANDGIYQDDWRMAVKLPGQGTESLGFLLEAGHPLYYVILRALSA